jgi:hypothetical protein
VIELEPHKKGYRQYTEMLNQKLEELDQGEAATKQRIKPYEQSLKPASLHKLKKMQNFFDDPRPRDQHATLHPDPARREKTLFNNLPKISKSNQDMGRNSELPLEGSSVEKEKDTKSISVAERLGVGVGRGVFKGKKLSINRDRSEKSFHLNKSSLFKKPEISIEGALKEVKHDEFMTFLRKRQEELLGPGSTSKQRISEAIEEAIS